MYCDWKQAGHAACPGATVVYDRPSPVFEPHEVREYEQFEQQREELKRQVFDPDQLQPIDQFVTYWKDQQTSDSTP